MSRVFCTSLKNAVMTFMLIVFIVTSTNAQRISVRGNEFYVDHSRRIWLNGVNTPWHIWNEFGVNFDGNWWSGHFKTLKNHGINCARVWISCNGAGGVKTDASGVTGLSSVFFRDCDSLFIIARKYGIYINATLISFDHFKNTNENHMNWRNVITNATATQTFIDNYLVPFVNRYKSNPWLFAIDLCNEPEWISENMENGQLPVRDLQRFIAMCAAAVHSISKIPVTVGSACIKWNSDMKGCAGNYWKNAALQAAFNHPLAFLDFYCIHYYKWVQKWFKSPFELTPGEYGINDKPVIIEECPAGDEGYSEIPITITVAFEKSLEKGYQGIMPWTSNGVDGNGNISTMGSAALSFKNNHPGLVYPSGNP